MKPDRPVARRSDFTFRSDITHAEASRFIAAHHYAQRTAKQSAVRTGLYVGDQLVAATLWMPPLADAAKQAALWFLGDRARYREVLTLSRMATLPGMPQNTTGILLARSMRAALEDPRWALLTTYADTRMGHRGTVYTACGWHRDEAHPCKPSRVWLDVDGKQYTQFAGRNIPAKVMRERGLTPVSSVKLRFVYPPPQEDA